jgi:hypothetical protein
VAQRQFPKALLGESTCWRTLRRQEFCFWYDMVIAPATIDLVAG